MRMMKGLVRGGVVRLAEAIFCATLLAIPATSSPFTATGTINQYFSGGGDPGAGQPKVTATEATWNHFFDNGSGLSAGSFAESRAGELKTQALVTLDWNGWASGSITATSRATLLDLLMPDWTAAAAHADSNTTTALVFDFSVLLSGFAIATSDSGDNAGASVGYTARVGDAYASGERGRSSGGTTTDIGEWGDVIFAATVPWASNVNLDLSAYAYAAASKTYLSFPKADALGDFTHTLRWGGVRRIWAVDAQGNRRELTGAYIPVIGRDTGFDYFYGVPAATTDVPEPSTMLLLGAGLCGVWWRRRRA